MSQLHTDLISSRTNGTTATTATTALHKDLRRRGVGTCSGTQVEQWKRCTAVPALKAEQEHKWYNANRCWAWVFGVCSAVPLVIKVVGCDVLLCRSSGVQQ